MSLLAIWEILFYFSQKHLSFVCQVRASSALSIQITAQSIVKLFLGKQKLQLVLKSTIF
jgi:hypothetical protein